jgi:hypothetical protein
MSVMSVMVEALHLDAVRAIPPVHAVMAGGEEGAGRRNGEVRILSGDVDGGLARAVLVPCRIANDFHESNAIAWHVVLLVPFRAERRFARGPSHGRCAASSKPSPPGACSAMVGMRAPSYTKT